MIDYAYKNENIKRFVLPENSNGTKKSCLQDLFPINLAGQWNGKMLKIFRFLILFFNPMIMGINDF
jgi:hypothetical protein